MFRNFVYWLEIVYSTGYDLFFSHTLARRHACGFQNLVWTPVQSASPGLSRIKVAIKIYCGHVPTSTCPQAQLITILHNHV